MTSIRVSLENAGLRLDRFLTARGDLGSRSQVQRLIEAGRVRLNGEVVKAGASLRRGDTISIEPEEETSRASASTRPEAEDIALDILHEDDDMLVLNKPAGLVVHPAPGHWRGTLVSALLHHWRGPRPGLDELRPGIVHRLDRDTSGVLVIGKTPEVVARLAAQFKAREVEKEYAAIVWRCPRPRRGVIDKPIGRHPRQRQRMSIRAAGRRAVTHYEVVDDFGDVSLLRLGLETGRTHQLRVHLADLGHPIVGDGVYGRARNVADAMLRDFPRQALHAARLELTHPVSGARMRFEAPMPPDFDALLKHLRGREKRGASRR